MMDENLGRLLAKLTPEQRNEWDIDNLFYGRAALLEEADGSVRVISPAELANVPGSQPSTGGSNGNEG